MDGFNIGQILSDGLSVIVEYLPQVLGAILVIIIGYIVAAILRSLTRRLLQNFRLDRSVTYSPVGKYVTQVMESPTRFLSKTVYYLVLLGFLSVAVTVLNLPILTAFVAAIYSYLPNVLAAIIIFLVASAIAAGSSAFVLRVLGKGSPLARLATVVIPAVTMSIAVFMILNQLGIARDIVNITYTALIGSVALGSALAFGLGGREVAVRLLEQAYDSALQNADGVRREAKRGAANAKAEADRVRREREPRDSDSR